MEFEIIKNYREAITTDARYIILMGGRGAGRSYFASQLITGLLKDAPFLRCALMRFVLTDIRNSIFQEVIDRIDEQELPCIVNDGSLIVKLGQNFIKGMGFRKSSGDQKSKLKSLASFNYIVIEEADEVAEEDFLQLDDSLRTLKADIKIILLLNCPDKNHWIIRRWFNLLPSGVEGYYMPQLKDSEKHNTLYIHTTWKNNAKNLNQSTKDNWLRYQTTRPDHYHNMICGLVSEGARGRIYKNWKPITAAEYEALPYETFYGLDFGFTNDPTALVELKQHNETVWAKELIYESGLTNQRIAQRIAQLGVSRSAYIYADSAEPKSIEELRQEDWNVVPSKKGQDSVRSGISMVSDQQVFYTEDSKNIAIESQEYKWALDRNKEPLNEPIDDFNHICDAIRYGIVGHNTQAFVGFA
jgi:phage terminase large subunit